jgi:hypothetical protein
MLWELAGLKDRAPAAEKGFSMMTAVLKKRISENRKTEKKRKDHAETQRTRSLAKKTRPRKSRARKTKAKTKRG